MPLSSDEAIEVARRHGLGLNDAVGLMSLAEDVDEAERIAGRFAQSSQDEFASVAVRLFGPAGSRRKVQLSDYTPDDFGGDAA